MESVWMSIRRLVGVSFVAVACGPAPARAPVSAMPTAEPQIIPGIPAADLSALVGADRDNWKDTLDQTLAVIASEEFQTALSGYSALDPRKHAPDVRGADVLALYTRTSLTSGQLAAHYVSTSDGCGSQTASTLWLPRNRPYKFAQVSLNTCTRQRAASSDVYTRACAVNTAAHELTHTIIDNGVEVFQDKGHGGASGRLVSYTVGAIAQCVYLDQHGKLAEQKLSVSACVERVGPTFFDPHTCCADWEKVCDK